MKLIIKNMVSNRCKIAVREELKKLGLHFILVDLGEVEIMETLSGKQWEQLKTDLHNIGLELMEDKRTVLIEKMKTTLIEMIRNQDETTHIKLKDYLSEKLHCRYSNLASLFSEVQGISIQHFIVLQKIELIKELIIYDELNITEIASKLNYSSVAHLSNQFKSITGISPARFKQLMHTPITQTVHNNDKIKSSLSSVIKDSNGQEENRYRSNASVMFSQNKQNKPKSVFSDV